MYKYTDNTQSNFLDFNQPIGLHMNPENRWVKMADAIPWEVFEKKNHIIIETGIELMTKKAIIIQRRMISLRQPGVLPASSTAILKINTTF